MAIKATSVIIEFADLVTNKNLQPLIEQAYGPKGIFSDIKVMEYCLLMAFLNIQSKGKRHYLCSISWLICLRTS